MTDIMDEAKKMIANSFMMRFIDLCMAVQT